MKKLLILFLLISANQVFAKTVRLQLGDKIVASFKNFETLADVKKALCEKITLVDSVTKNKISEKSNLESIEGIKSYLLLDPQTGQVEDTYFVDVLV